MRAHILKKITYVDMFCQKKIKKRYVMPTMRKNMRHKQTTLVQ